MFLLFKRFRVFLFACVVRLFVFWLLTVNDRVVVLPCVQRFRCAFHYVFDVSCSFCRVCCVLVLSVCVVSLKCLLSLYVCFAFACCVQYVRCLLCVYACLLLTVLLLCLLLFFVCASCAIFAFVCVRSL